MSTQPTGSSISRLSAALLIATVMALSGLLLAGPPPAAATSVATLSPEVSRWLADATDDATLTTIVTFDDRSGLDRLDALGVGGSRYEALPMAVAALTPSQVLEVASWPETRSLWEDTANDFILDESVALIGADRVHAGDGLRMPYTGAGIGVAVIDTGADSSHPDLAHVTTYNVAGDPLEKDGVVIVPGPTVDTYGHGTHVSSTIAGTGAASAGRYVGVAPGASVHSFKTDAGAVLLNSWALRVFDWILTHPEANIRVSSNSWGSGDGTDYEPDNPVNVATKMLYDAGVTVVFAASNSGGPNTLNQYATSPWVVSVAASDKSLNLADFSSRGRIDDNWDRAAAQANGTGIYRPTVTAPGVDINAAKSAAATLMAPGVDPENPFYTYASGTSMATPHVAGAVALMLDARDTLTPGHVIAILEGTADPMPAYEVFEVGMGHLDAYEAVQAAEKGKVRFRPNTGGKTPEYSLTARESFSGTVVAPNTWQLAECPDSTGLLNHHEFTVTEGTGAVYTEIEWPSTTDLLYLVLYDPNCEVAGESAALLDIGFVNHRALLVTSPQAGTWTVAVYGRINLPTAYTGSFETYDRN
ncbi:MAG TPA: S8 family serine peptidase [Candidatus Limnocylindria bacterium]|nr:S8 family serine peptidase [Candidatus Limnocylindria bacterium]